MIEHNSSSDGIDPGLAGLSISYFLQVKSYLYETKAELFVLWDQITQSLNWIVCMTNKLEANLRSCCEENKGICWIAKWGLCFIY